MSTNDFTGVSLSASSSAYLSTLFDVGGIAGGVCAGVASDRIGGRRATTCAAMLTAAVPTVNDVAFCL